jgi:hypothetical protein
VLENALIGTSDLFNRNIIEHVVCDNNRSRYVVCDIN